MAATNEVLISRLFELLPYHPRNTRRSADRGKIIPCFYPNNRQGFVLTPHSQLNSVSVIPISANLLFSHTPPSSPSEYPCLYPNCGHISSRAHDLKRHYTVHFPPAVEELLDCKYEWCGRTGAHGFKREDHRKEHYRKVHMKGSEYPKRHGRRNSRSSSD